MTSVIRYHPSASNIAGGALGRFHECVRASEETAFHPGMNALRQTPNTRARSLCAQFFCPFSRARFRLGTSCDVRIRSSTDIALGTKSDRPVSVHDHRHDPDRDHHRPRPRPSQWFRLLHRERVCVAFHRAGRSRTCYSTNRQSCRRTHPAECARL